jgi:hypothetical protein
MERRRWLVGVVSVLAGSTLGYAGWRTFRSNGTLECYACKRPIHDHSKTVAFADGRSRLFCCPACALSEHEQTGKPVTITRLTSFLTGEPLAPENAYVVRGSDVNMCIRDRGIIDADKRPAGLHFDRCEPSLYAFAQLGEASQFARQHGGEVMLFREAEAAFSK